MHYTNKMIVRERLSGKHEKIYPANRKTFSALTDIYHQLRSCTIYIHFLNQQKFSIQSYVFLFNFIFVLTLVTVYFMKQYT